MLCLYFIIIISSPAIGGAELFGKIPESQILVRDTGIEPVSQPWEGRILPLN